MKYTLLLLVLSIQSGLASRNFNFSSADGGVSNKALYEALKIKEKIISKRKSKGYQKKKPVVFSVTDFKKSNKFFECVKTQYSVKKVKSFAVYTCKFKIDDISFVEKNINREKNYMALISKDRSLEKFIFENTPDSKAVTTNGVHKKSVKSFGQFRSLKRVYPDKTSYGFYLEN